MKLIQLQEQILENTLLQHDMTSILPHIEDGKEVVYTVKRGREENELCLKLQRIGENVYATGSYFVGIDWLKENAKDMSFDGVKDDLCNLSLMLPYSFEIYNHQYEMTYFNEIFRVVSLDTNKIWEIKESQLYLIWDDIRVRAVFSEKEADDIEKIVYGLLYATGYLSKIRIYDSKSDEMVSGYQINSGLGRVLGFMES